jgi:hypothetical protein
MHQCIPRLASSYLTRHGHFPTSTTPPTDGPVSIPSPFSRIGRVLDRLLDMTASTSSASEAHKLLSPDELAQALKIDVFDNEGKTHVLGDLTKGRRTALIFTRHFCKSISHALYVLVLNQYRVCELSSLLTPSECFCAAIQSSSKHAK